MTFRERKTMGVLRAAMSRVEGTARDVGGLLRTEFGSTAETSRVPKGNAMADFALVRNSSGHHVRIMFDRFVGR